MLSDRPRKRSGSRDRGGGSTEAPERQAARPSLSEGGGLRGNVVLHFGGPAEHTEDPRGAQSEDQKPQRSAALKNGSVTFIAPRKTRSLVKG